MVRGMHGHGDAVQGHLDGDRWIVANLGDSLWSLATTFHISIKDLKKANGMTKVRKYCIFILHLFPSLTHSVIGVIIL